MKLHNQAQNASLNLYLDPGQSFMAHIECCSYYTHSIICLLCLQPTGLMIFQCFIRLGIRGNTKAISSSWHYTKILSFSSFSLALLPRFTFQSLSQITLNGPIMNDDKAQRRPETQWSLNHGEYAWSNAVKLLPHAVGFSWNQFSHRVKWQILVEQTILADSQGTFWQEIVSVLSVC